ncbi:Uncharacterised protein [Mycobacteroides abscessus subsp. abscessus]|nr:Uncharacterised protein [Mycobacteroides abscessus subsp. abscessus]
MLTGGSPASRSNKRSHVSLGDCAPGSTSSKAVRARRTPRIPACLDASSSASEIWSSVARHSASIAATARPRGHRQARSRAVRAAVVARIPRTTQISSGAISPDQTVIPGCRCRLS